MATTEIIIPKLGESVIEATITRWLKNEGETIKEDEPLVEIATDKVDSEIPSPVSGILVKKLFAEGDIVSIGQAFAIIESEQVAATSPSVTKKEVIAPPEISVPQPDSSFVAENRSGQIIESAEIPKGTRFYSPLVRSIAKQENIPMKVLDTITGSGKDDRLTKEDLLDFLQKKTRPVSDSIISEQVLSISGEDQIIEMTRIRQLTAQHMVRSVQTSPHVTSFLEVDMTGVVQWREKNKEDYQKKYNQKLTFTPIFICAMARAVTDFPMINVSVDGSKIILHPKINVGMAVALPNFNLIVPVVKNVGQKNFHEIVSEVNDLAERSRKSKLLPDEVFGGTISITNLGSFNTTAGTPIINQPQAAIVAVGLIKKRPVVIESPEGDMIAIRSIMIMSVTYDHRVIDGALGGQFLSRLKHYLENFDHP